MVANKDSASPGTSSRQNQKRRFDDRDLRLRQLEKEVRELRAKLHKMNVEQARMLGFLEGRGVMGKAPAESETAA